MKRDGFAWGIAAFVVVVCGSLQVSAQSGAEPAPRPSGFDVEATGFSHDGGHALFVIYRGPEGWLKLEKAMKVVRQKVVDKKASARFDVAPGEYAIFVIHDENQNGKMDMHWLPIPGPDEPSGFSNDPKPELLSAPSYRKSAVKLSTERKPIRITVRPP